MLPPARLSAPFAPAAALLLVAAALNPAAIASATGARATISGEIRVARPETRASRERLRARHERAAPLRAQAALSVLDAQTGAIVRRETVVTNTTFVLVLAPGVYRIAARIGPPLVNPSSRSCGVPRIVRAQAARRAFLTLSCTLG